MVTLMDLGNEVMKIREAADAIEVKGKQNAALLVYVYETCNRVIGMINEAAQQIQNGSKEGADHDGDPDTGDTE